MRRPLICCALSEDLVKQAALLVQQGNTMAESGNFKAAIVKWRDSVLYAPNPVSLVLLVWVVQRCAHPTVVAQKILEQMAQAHIMLGNDFGAIQTASHAHELDPLWAPVGNVSLVLPTPTAADHRVTTGSDNACPRTTELWGV